ncbi:MAG: efflux RND transporter permease subunit, partial [Bacteroidales bacterium]|nr:efflux RND transporter permease subunit [Candidatus Colicola coprequi]
LKDIATISRQYQQSDKWVDFYENARNSCLVVNMEMVPGNNIVAFGEDVDEIVNKVREDLPQDIHFHRITDQPKVVRMSVHSFLRDILISIIVVILVMLLLFPIRTALVASTGVPVCTAICIGLMYLTGIELNTVTLAALIFVLGMIVDDSVIVIDGYQNLLEKGHSRWYSAAVSTKQLFVPMALATCAISGMFFPMTKIITGPLGEFVRLFPFAVLFALTASIFYAAWVTPYLSTQFIRLRKPEEMNRFERGQYHFFEKLQYLYKRCLSACFSHPWIVYLMIAFALTAGIALMRRCPMQLLPKAERECFAVEIHLQEGSTIQQTALVADSMARILVNDERIVSVTSFVGQASPRFHATYTPQMAKPNYAQFIVNTGGANATTQVLKEFSQHYENYFPNAYLRFKQMDYQAAKNPLEVRFQGDDLDAMMVYVDSLKQFMATQSELQWVHSDYDEYSNQWCITLHPEEATRLGVTETMLSLYLHTVTNGIQLTTVWEKDYNIPVMLYTEEGSDLTAEQLSDLPIPTAYPGVWVPLRQIADIQPAWHHATINRRNGIRTITVGCDLRGHTSQVKAEKKIKHWIDELWSSEKLPCQITYGGLSAINGQIVPEILWSIVAALLVMFVLMLYHFGKVSLSLLALSSALLTILGAFLGLWIFQLDTSITAVLGCVSLIGIIVRNAIMMYEYAEELRKTKHFSARDAAFEAGLRRMRPVFLTTATTALGVLPMIIAHTSLWMPMGVVICFGAIFTLPFTVTILPVLYWKMFALTEKNHQSPITNHKSQITNHKSLPCPMRERVGDRVLSILPFAFCLLPSMAQAQTLTLDSCLSLARMNNAALRKADIQVEKAKQVKANAFTNYFPQVKATAMGYHSLYPLVELGIDDVANANARDVLTTLYGNYGAALGLDNTLALFQYGYHVGVTAIQPVFMGGKIVAGNRLAQVGVEAAQLQRDITARDVLMDVEESYWLIVGLEEKQQTLIQSISLMDTIYRTLSKAVEAGLALNTELMQVELKQEELHRLQVQLHNGLRLARRALAQSIGVDSIGVENGEWRMQNAKCKMQNGEWRNENGECKMQNAEGTSLHSPSPFWGSGGSPESQLLDLQVQAAKLERQMVLADALPQIAVGANYGYGKLQTNVLRNDLGREKGNGAVFVTVTVPISQWWATGHKLREHDLHVDEVQLEQDELNQKLSLRTQQLYDQMLESQWLVIECQKALDKAKEYYRLQEVNYRAGMANITDLMTAQSLLMKAQNDLTDALIARHVTARKYANWISPFTLHS